MKYLLTLFASATLLTACAGEEKPAHLLLCVDGDCYHADGGYIGDKQTVVSKIQKRNGKDVKTLFQCGFPNQPECN